MLTKREQIIETARKTLEIESKAIQDLVGFLNDDFIDAVLSILSIEGRVIVTGIGKSAIIGQKIVATLNSTGTPALYMHAADAIHGDLGMIRKEDIVICISKSGNTPEIKALVPFLMNFGNEIIAMVGNTDSFLANHAQYILPCGVTEEADPNNLAPTASSTAQLAIGDALAVALLKARGFTPKDFAAFHPGGALGKQLYLRARDLAKKHLKPAVSPDDSIKKIILEISSKRLGATVVISNENKIIGIVTDGDLRRMLESEKDVTQLTAKDVCSINPLFIQAEELAVNALRMMRKNSISQLLVLEDEAYIGMIHIHDLIEEGLI